MKLTDIGTNALEDGVEDFASNFIYRRMRRLTEPLKDGYKSDSEFDEAMTSFINTLSMGLAMYALNKIMGFFFQRGAKLMTAMFTYIVYGKIANKIANKIKNTKTRGKPFLKRAIMLTGLDRTPERIEMMKIAQSNVDSFDKNKMHYENQNANLQKQMDSLSSSVSTFKGSKDLKGITMFKDLTDRGAWQNTTAHKKIYETATGYKLSESGKLAWSSLYKELNKFTSFAKTAEGEINNLTQAINKLIAVKGS